MRCAVNLVSQVIAGCASHPGCHSWAPSARGGKDGPATPSGTMSHQIHCSKLADHSPASHLTDGASLVGSVGVTTCDNGQAAHLTHLNG